jgi:hypothetical protein
MVTNSHHTALAHGRAGQTRWVYVGGLLVASSLTYANWRAPVLRFAWQPLNLTSFLLACIALPTAAAVAFVLRPRWVARSVALLLALPSVGALVLAFGTAVLLVDTLMAGADPSFTPVRAVAAGSYDLRVYRRNGGATTNYGAVVRQERT